MSRFVITTLAKGPKRPPLTAMKSHSLEYPYPDTHNQEAEQKRRHIRDQRKSFSLDSPYPDEEGETVAPLDNGKPTKPDLLSCGLTYFV